MVSILTAAQTWLHISTSPPSLAVAFVSLLEPFQHVRAAENQSNQTKVDSYLPAEHTEMTECWIHWDQQKDLVWGGINLS